MESSRRRRRTKIDFSELEVEAGSNDESGDDFVAQSGPSDPSSPDVEDESTMDIDAPESDDSAEKTVKRRVSEGQSGQFHETKAKKISTSKKIKTEPVSVKLESDAPSKYQPNSKRIESLRDRMQLFYGMDSETLARAVQWRIDWETTVFVPSIEKSQALFNAQEKINKVELPIKASYSPCGRKSLPACDVVVDGYELKPGDMRQTQNIFIMNVGATISVVRWRPGNDSWLAIGVLDDTDESTIDSSSSRPSLSVMSTVGGPSRLILAELTETFRIVSTLWIDEGPVRDLAWQPVSDSEYLAVVCQNGKCGVINLGPNGNQNVGPVMVELEYLAACVCWSNPYTLVVGTAEGYIALFELDSDSDSFLPSWVLPVHYSTITSITSAGPDHPYSICTASVDGYTRVIDLRDVKRRHLSGPRNSHASYITAWSPLAESFIGPEDLVTSKLVPLRNPSVQVTSTSLTKHLGTIMSAAASPYHPIVLTGGDDGSVYVSNVLRRATVTRRNKAVHKQCCVWSLECNERSSEFRFVELLKVEEISKGKSSATTSAGNDRYTNVHFFPKSCTVTSVSWSLTKGKTSWYAAGTASGLLRVENLDISR